MSIIKLILQILITIGIRFICSVGKYVVVFVFTRFYCCGRKADAHYYKGVRAK